MRFNQPMWLSAGKRRALGIASRTSWGDCFDICNTIITWYGAEEKHHAADQGLVAIDHT